MAVLTASFDKPFLTLETSIFFIFIYAGKSPCSLLHYKCYWCSQSLSHVDLVSTKTPSICSFQALFREVTPGYKKCNSLFSFFVLHHPYWLINNTTIMFLYSFLSFQILIFSFLLFCSLWLLWYFMSPSSITKGKIPIYPNLPKPY